MCEEPRITVPCTDDALTVYAALVMYSRALLATSQVTGDLGPLLTELPIVAALIAEINESEAHKEAREVFGAVPSDDEMYEAIKRMKREMG